VKLLAVIGAVAVGALFVAIGVAFYPVLPYIPLFMWAYFKETLVFTLLAGLAAGYAIRMFHVRYRDTGTIR